MTMKLTIALLFAAISCCAAMCCDSSKWNISKPEGMNFAIHLKEIYRMYDDAQNSTSKDSQLKSVGHELTSLVRHFSEEVGCSTNEFLIIMGMGDRTIKALDKLLDEGHGDGSQNIEEVVLGLVKPMTGILLKELKKAGIDLEKFLRSVGDVQPDPPANSGLTKEVIKTAAGTDRSLKKTDGAVDKTAGVHDNTKDSVAGTKGLKPNTLNSNVAPVKNTVGVEKKVEKKGGILGGILGGGGRQG